MSLVCTLGIAEGPQGEVNDLLLEKPYNPIFHLGYGAKDLISADSAVILGSGGGATLLSFFLADRVLKNHFADRDRLNGWGWLGDNVLGTGGVGVAIATGCVTVGLLARNPRELHSGLAHFEGLFGSFIATSALKFSIRRQRPEGSNRLSFPSGHTSTMFTTATNLFEFYGPLVGIPAMSLAAYTGFARMTSRRHHLSDVIFGATIGVLFSHAFNTHHKEELAEVEKHNHTKKTAFAVIPAVTALNDFSFSLKWEF